MSKRKIDYIQGLSSEMVQNDSERNDLYNKIDDMINLHWDLPEEIRKLKWIRKVISTDPQAALKTAIRTLSTVEPIPFYQPTNKNEETVKAAHDIEMNLLWQLKQADKRSEHRIVPDIVESALRYDTVVTQTIPLKWQLEAMEDMGGDAPTRYRAAKNLGAFMVITHNPKGIHSRHTPLGLDKVLSVKVMKADEAIAFWGKDRTKELWNDIEDEEGEVYVTVFDYWDYNQRTVWAVNNGNSFHRASPDSQDYIFMDEEMDMPFLPWTVKKGGTSLEFSEEHAVRPMLRTIADAELWETQNILQSITTSEAIGYSAAPRLKIIGPDSDNVRVDYGDINKPLRLKPGEDVEPMSPPQFDQNLMHLNDRIQAAMDKDTVAKSLQNLDFPSGTAFATVNAVIKSATAALDPYKILAQDAVAGVWEDMLRWTTYTKDALIGYGYNDANMGSQYVLKPEYIDPEHIYVDARLTAHVPTDFLQRIEAAIALKNQMNFPKDEAYKHLDVTNPDQLIDKWTQERLDEHELQLRMQDMAAEHELEQQKKQMQLQMQAQQAAQQQQMQAQQAAQQRQQATQSQQNVRRSVRQGMGREQGRTGAPRREALSQAVQGNPAKTGISPNQSNAQGNLREQRTFRARGGEERA